MNDDLILLASRYLDDDVSADERAQVESDQELLAEVARMRAVRDALADVPAPADDDRDAAIAAALAAFDTAFDAPAAPPVASLAARRRARWLLPVAAAIVAVLALGGLAGLLANSGGDDDDDAASDAELLTESAEITAAGDEDAGGGADTAQESLLAAPSETSADTGRAATAPATEGTTGGATTRDASFQLLTSPDELRDFATGEAPADVTPEAATATTLSDVTDLLALADTCDLGELIGGALYAVDGREEFVIVVVDADEALAVTPACAVVARTPLP